MAQDAPRRIPIAGDARTVVVYAAVVLVLWLAGITNQPFMGGDPVWPGWVSLVLMLVGAGFTGFRTSRPGIMLAVVMPLSLAELLFGGQGSAYVLLVEALWAPVARGSGRVARVTTAVGVGLGILLGGVLLAVGLSDLPWTTAVVFALLMVVVIVATPLAWAWEVRHHRLAQEAAEELARTEHELAGERAAREVEADRLGIAQDLHDVVAGHLSAVTLHTSLAAELPEEDARTRSLETARTSAEAALRDLRSVIGVLATAQDSAAQPTLSWDILRRRLGDDAAVSVDGNVEDPDTVPAPVRSALLHIGAEAVTNATRHGAQPRSLSVTVHDGNATLDCVNDLRAGSSSGDDPSVGGPTLGLRAMSNRAEAVGGCVDAGPDAAHGQWRVTARVPLEN
ncbi:MAG: sensor histidine kinase [Mycobacteriaceae bacterium]|uniref:sensor histidine kinase n=1 Tax=Corynebacterium sp. TaxID=1720 RepID=UPI003F9BE55F